MRSADELVVVFSGNSFDAQTVKNHLEVGGIRAVLQDEHIGRIVPYVAAGGVGSVKVVVRLEDATSARRLIQSLHDARPEPNAR